MPDPYINYGPFRLPRRFGNETNSLTLRNLPPHVALDVSFTLWLWQSPHPKAVDRHQEVITLRADGEFIAEETWPVVSAGGYLGGQFPHSRDSAVLELAASGLQEPRDGYGDSSWEIHKVKVNALACYTIAIEEQTIAAGDVGEVMITVKDPHGDPIPDMTPSVEEFDESVILPAQDEIITDARGLARLQIQGLAPGRSLLVLVGPAEQRGRANQHVRDPNG